MQTRTHSVIESLVNILIGLVVSVTANHLILPLVYGRSPSMAENVFLAVAYTIVSFIRSYGLRRLFNRYRHIRFSSKNAGVIGQYLRD